jgi:hypothetical protein
MRLKLLLAALLLAAGVGVLLCLPGADPTTAPSANKLTILLDVSAARKQAAATGKPLLVLNVLGDCHKHC